MELSIPFQHTRRLERLVENQTTYTVETAELSLFETHQQAANVLLDFDQPVLASMICGKKIMRLSDREEFPFLPGESVLLPANEWMGIDFPEATLENPTKCLAMTISMAKLEEVVQWMNEQYPKSDQRDWCASVHSLHFTNDIAVHQLLQRLVFLFSENHPNKDVFVELMLKELLMRLFQAESAHSLEKASEEAPSSNRIAYILNFIRENISSKLSIEQLSKKACMSESHFYRVFKNELGLSPVEYINNERVKLAARLLRNPEKRIREVYLECGFNSPSYFTRLFKRKHTLSPKEYQLRVESLDNYS